MYTQLVPMTTKFSFEFVSMKNCKFLFILVDNTIDVSNQTLQPIQSVKSIENLKTNKTIEIKLVCPPELVRPFFSFPCKISMDCRFLGKNMVCCKNRCQKGIPPPKPEIHERKLLMYVY